MKLTKSILRNLIKEELVAVKGGLGSMRLDQIQTDLRRKLEDLLARADAGAYHTIGKNELDVLANMWLTVSETMPREQNEAWGGAKGPFPDRYGDAHKISPRRGHPMYKTDDELREIGADIGNILELTEKVISNLSEMQARYGEMAHMGAYARMAKTAAETLSEKYRDALDALSRSKQREKPR